MTFKDLINEYKIEECPNDDNRIVCDATICSKLLSKIQENEWLQNKIVALNQELLCEKVVKTEKGFIMEIK